MCKLFNRKKSKSVEYIPNEIRLCTNNGVLRIAVRDNASLSLTYVSEPAREKLGYRFVNENQKELMHILGCAIATIKQYFGTEPKGALEELQEISSLQLSVELKLISLQFRHSQMLSIMQIPSLLFLFPITVRHLML